MTESTSDTWTGWKPRNPPGLDQTALWLSKICTAVRDSCAKQRCCESSSAHGWWLRHAHQEAKDVNIFWKRFVDIFSNLSTLETVDRCVMSNCFPAMSELVNERIRSRHGPCLEGQIWIAEWKRWATWPLQTLSLIQLDLVAAMITLTVQWFLCLPKRGYV